MLKCLEAPQLIPVISVRRDEEHKPLHRRQIPKRHTLLPLFSHVIWEGSQLPD